MKGWSFVVILFLIALLASAQPRVYSFRHYSSAEGLSDQHIRCLKFDREGFLWIGTHGGLHRFDGEHFEVFRKQENGLAGVCGNIITAIEEDGEGGLWIGSADAGFCHLNQKMLMDNKPLIYYHDKFEVTDINDIELTEKGELLVATGHGLFTSKSPYHEFELVNGRKPLAYMDLMQEDSITYCGQVVGGLIWYESEIFQNHEVDPPLSAGHTLQTFYKASDGRIFAGGWDEYLHVINRHEPYQEHISIVRQLPEIAGDELVAITEAESGFLWLATKSGKLLRYDLKTGIFERIQTSSEERKRLHGTKIYAMSTDDLGRTWIATDAGLHVYNPLQSVFDVFWLPENNAVVEDLLVEDKKLYAASLSGLFIRENATWKYVPDAIQTKYRAHMVRRHGEDLLVGTNYNLLRLENGILKLYYPRMPYSVTELISSRVDDLVSVYINGKEYFLINMYGYGTAIGEVQGTNWLLGMVVSDNTHENLVNGIFKDREAQIWFAGTGIPVSRYLNSELAGNPFPLNPWIEFRIPEPAHFNTQLFRQKDISQHMEDMIQDDRGQFWVASMGSGLLKFNPHSEGETFQEIQGSPLSIHRLAVDKKGRIWMLSSGGLHCYHPMNQLWTHYTELDGLPTGGLHDGLTIDSSGVLFAGGQGFVVSLNTKKQWVNSEKPKTKITGIDANGIHYYSAPTLGFPDFPFDQNSIQIHFSSMCFTFPEKYQFEYKLSGADEHWHSLGTENSVTFNQLSPGAYTFEVRAIAENGVVEEYSNAIFSWRVLPPFYKTWWFIALVFAMLISLIIGFMMYRLRQFRKIEEVRNKLARDLHDDVGSALGSISFYSETARLSIDNGNLDQARNVTIKMGETSRKMIENIHDIVWAVNPSHDDSMHLIERMQTHIADIHSNGGIKIQFNAHPEISGLRLGMKTRKNIFLVFKEAIYNAIKYSESSLIEVRLLKSSGRIIMQITDFGKGFDLSDTSIRGNGLRNMKARAEELSGQLEVVSSRQGTTIKLTIPIA